MVLANIVQSTSHSGCSVEEGSLPNWWQPSGNFWQGWDCCHQQSNWYLAQWWCSAHQEVIQFTMVLANIASQHLTVAAVWRRHHRLKQVDGKKDRSWRKKLKKEESWAKMDSSFASLCLSLSLPCTVMFMFAVHFTKFYLFIEEFWLTSRSTSRSPKTLWLWFAMQLMSRTTPRWRSNCSCRRFTSKSAGAGTGCQILPSACWWRWSPNSRSVGGRTRRKQSVNHKGCSPTA